jgi:hypothetical protein
LTPRLDGPGSFVPIIRWSAPAEADLALLGLRLQPLLTGFLHDIRGGPVQVERRLLDGPDDVRIHGRQKLSFVAGTAAVPLSRAERRADAKDYGAEMCSECGNFTLVRNGTCMKCDRCGSTTGCS